MNKEKYYKFMLICAGLYNCINAVVFIISSIFILEVFPSFGVAVPISMIWLHLTLIFIIVYGIGYFMVSMNLEKNHGIIVIGAIAKVMFFIMTLIYMFLGDVNILVVTLGSIDLLFVCLFIEFLLKYEK